MHTIREAPLRSPSRGLTGESATLDDLEIAGGGIAGTSHTRAGRGSQDAMCWTRAVRSIVGVIADGCSSGRHSEVGAKLGARLFAEALSQRLERGASVADPTLWRRTCRDVLAHLRILANAMGGSLADTVADYFLFTIVGFAVTPSLTVVFSIGDGLVAVNGDLREVGPFPDNQPPYLAYQLLDATREAAAIVELQALRPTDQVESILVASDGAADLRDAARTMLPAGDAPVGPLSQFWSDAALFRNRDGVRRRLARINRDIIAADWEGGRLERAGGLLRDDTTLIALRRRTERT